MAEVFTERGSKFSPVVRVPSNNRGFSCASFPQRSWEIKRGLYGGFSDGRLVLPSRKFDSIKPSVISSPVPKGFQLGPKSMRWWENGRQSNMREIQSAQDLVDSLLKAGDKLVIVDFFSPGCPGCKALHPKICQFAEKNPDLQFLQVNYEKHKSMCYSLHVHVLPFFWFFRGAEGRLTGFSCTNQTIKKFRDALAKHGTERCSLGPTKGLDESLLISLASNKELDFNYTKKEEVETSTQGSPPVKSSSPISSSAEQKELVSSER